MYCLYCIAKVCVVEDFRANIYPEGFKYRTTRNVLGVTNLTNQAPFLQSCNPANHDLYLAVYSWTPDLNQLHDQKETTHFSCRPPSRCQNDMK